MCLVNIFFADAVVLSIATFRSRSGNTCKISPIASYALKTIRNLSPQADGQTNGTFSSLQACLYQTFETRIRLSNVGLGRTLRLGVQLLLESLYDDCVCLTTAAHFANISYFPVN
ncbi:MAG: hypothetical protein EZS28_009937 [Streblomastix strix]|uniref:Uncharacterized protein n=1 Tax=Streblomastix strix TaxID=222440 RepID=A0A5J4WHJ4_9EUKA|nr:MAG: hypothetical protein EZS28_009937 [Streblomastix strix]